MAEELEPSGGKPRRHFLIDRGFQLKYALLMALAGLLVADLRAVASPGPPAGSLAPVCPTGRRGRSSSGATGC